MVLYRSHPDWGVETDPATPDNFPLDELSARDGFLVNYVRRGRVLYFDDFSPPSGWNKYLLAGAVCELAIGDAIWNEACFKADMTPVFSVVELTRKMLLPAGDKYGVEFYFKLNEGLTPFTISGFLLCHCYSQAVSDCTEAGIRILITPATVNYQVYVTPGVYVTFLSKNTMTISPDIWTNVKFTWDTDTKKYIKFYLWGVEYDLSAYTADSIPIGPTSAPYLDCPRFRIEHTAGAITSAVFSLDAVLLTRNEF